MEEQKQVYDLVDLETGETVSVSLTQEEFFAHLERVFANCEVLQEVLQEGLGISDL